MVRDILVRDPTAQRVRVIKVEIETDLGEDQYAEEKDLNEGNPL